MDLGERISSLRKLKNLTLPQLADKAGVSKSYLWAIEKNREKNPSIEFLYKIAEALDTTIAELIGQEGVKVKAVIPKLDSELERFIDERRKNRKPISEEHIRAMNMLRFRRRKKKVTKDDWAVIYSIIEKLLGGEEI